MVESSGVLFEKDFIGRSYKTLTSNPSIAVTELIANCWDAGATEVKIVVGNGEFSIEDNGQGLTNGEFQERWLTLNYDRVKHQGDSVLVNGQFRRATYGRNGIGRHGLFCFDSSYTIISKTLSQSIGYRITEAEGEAPFLTEPIDASNVDFANGTILSVKMRKATIEESEIVNVISARFLSDPNFSIFVNGTKVEINSFEGKISDEIVKLENGHDIRVIVIDSSKTAVKHFSHGVAFWVNGRLVGDSSWSYGKTVFLDGRVKAAKSLTIIVEDDELSQFIKPDWSGFLPLPEFEKCLDLLKKPVMNVITGYMEKHISELQNSVLDDLYDDLEGLPLTGQRNVSSFLASITSNNPVISEDYLKASIKTLATIEKTNSGKELLAKIEKFSPEEVTKLNDLLETWSVDELASVMDEIDRRLSVIEALERVCGDPNTDELHTIHPLVLQSRWLFGPEFDSDSFVSNVALTTTIKNIYPGQIVNLDESENFRRRPDIVLLSQSTVSLQCIEEPDQNDMFLPSKILIIELKRGGFQIGIKERNQGESYVRAIRKSCTLSKTISFSVFVVGSTKDDDVDDVTLADGTTKVMLYSFGNLINSARKRMNHLNEYLKAHYDRMDKESLVEVALSKPRQEKLF